MPGWGMRPLAVPLLLLLLPLLLQAQQDTSSPRAPAGSIVNADTNGPTEDAAATAAVQQPVLTPPAWLGPQPTSDEASIRKKRPPVGDQQSDQTAAAVDPVTAAASKPRPRRFIVQLRTQSAAALVGPSILPAAASDTPAAAAAAAAAAGAEASDTEAGEEASAAAAGPSTVVRADRITPQAAAAAQAIQAQVQAVAAAAGVTAQVTHRYSYALSGFAVQAPTSAQLAALAADPQVASITEDKQVSIRTYTTPLFLGLPNVPRGPQASTHNRKPPFFKRGVWSQLGGVEGYKGAGENVIIGVLDTGAWLDNRTSFADTNYWAGGNSWRQDYKQLDDWKGVCSAAGKQQCSNKVIGCRYYTAGNGGDDALLAQFPKEELSCRDLDGHGSHTAATAAGNFGSVTAGTPAGTSMSGMAPRARLAIYKTMWGPQGAGQFSDLVAAIEDAIKDGVDVLSYSISSSVGTFRDSVMMAFMNAARAGIFVSAAASNEGPGPTVNAISPWVTSVAASTHDRYWESDLKLGNGQTITAPQPFARSGPIGPSPLVYAADVAAGNVTLAALCAPNSLNASAVPRPAIIACDRGTYVFQEKWNEASRVGGQMMIIMNVPGGNQTVFDLDLQFPYVHLTVPQRQTLLSYVVAAGAAAKATQEVAQFKLGRTAPAMASFSSRGPIPIANAILMKPDITAPGVSVYAAYTDRFGYLSGTSMATPHISGIAALIKDRYPYLSPMAIKSALMTTAYQTTRTGTTGQPFGTALDYGAGHVDPAKALNPGLVLDSNYDDWQRFLCDVEPFPGDDCATLCSESGPSSSSVAPSVVLESGSDFLTAPQHWKPPRPRPSPAPVLQPPPERLCDAVQFNGPSIAGEVSGSMVVVRTLTSVLPAHQGRVTFTATGSADAGSAFDVVVSPTAFKVKGRQSRKVTIAVRARADTPMNVYQFGQVVWRSSQGHAVRIPISVKFSEFVAPAYITPPLRLPAFEQRIRIGADAATAVTITNLGAHAGTVTPVQLKRQPDAAAPNLNNTGVGKVEITVPPGNKYFAVGIFKDDVAPATDLDLFLYQGDTELGRSATEDSTEILEAVKGLEPGTYTAYIYPYSMSAASMAAYLHVWMLPSGAGAGSGVMQVSPASMRTTPGDMGCCPITLAFSGLDFAGEGDAPGGNRYIGAISYTRADGKPTNLTRVYLL